MYKPTQTWMFCRIMYSLALLILVGTFLSAQGQDEWERCAEGPCDCLPNTLRVRCRFLPIEDIVSSQYFPSDTHRVDLRDNGMIRLPENFFVERPMPTLKELRLRDNPLTELSSADFVGLSHLPWLSIDNTQLTTLPEDLLFELKSLRLAWIIRNEQLESIPDSLFYGLNELKTVSIDGNTKLTEIPRRLFLGTQNTLDFVTIRDGKNITEDGLPNDIFFSADTGSILRLEDIGLTVLRKGVFGTVTYPGSTISVRFNWDLQ